MSSRIIHKRNLTSGIIPTTSSLLPGELAINIADGKLFLRKSGSLSDEILPLVTSNTYTSGSIIAENFTGSLHGTSSWANNSITASYVLNTISASYSVTSSYTENAQTASYVLSASYAQTASYIQLNEIDGFISYSSSVSSRVSSLENFSSSLDATFITDAELNTYTASVDIRLSALEIESGSIRSDFNNFTASYTIDSASFSSRVSTSESDIIALQSFSSSLDDTFATDAQLNAATSSLSSSIADLSSSYLNTSSSFSSGINANASDITALSSSFISFSGSYNTGSFTGNLQGTSSWATNAISSSHALNADNTISASHALTASYVNPLHQDVIITGSLLITGSTTQIGDNTLLGNTTLSGSIIISGSIGPGSPTASVQIYGDIQQSGYHRFDPVNTNIDSSISASYIYVSGSTNDLYFSQNSNGYSNTTRLRWLEGNIYTGILTGGVVSGNVGGTTFNVSSGSGIIVTLNATTASIEPYPTINYVEWPSFTNITPTYLNTQDTTWLGIDSNGNLIQQANSFINGQFDDSLQIGSVIHPNLSTISLFKTFTVTSYGIAQQTYEFIRSFGAIKVSGHTISPSGSSLSVNRDSGVAFSLGRNYVNDANKPSLVTDVSYIAPNIFRYHKSGSAFVTSTGTTTLDPTQYNTPNTSTGLSAVPGGQYTIQRIFYFPNQTNTLGVYYGRQTYNSISTARANLPYETFEENNNTLTQAIFVAYVIVKSGTTDLSNTSDAQFIQAGTFRNTTSGGGGAATISLDDLSDVVISSVQQGDLLVYNGVDWKNLKHLTGSYDITGSLQATSFTGSLLGTSSFATQALSSSFATTASFAPNYVLNSVTSSMLQPYVLTSQTSSMSVASASYVNISGVDGFVNYSSSVSTRITNLENFSSSLDATFATDTQLNAYTASTNIRLNSLEIESGSIRSNFNTFTSSYNTDSSSFASGISTNTTNIANLTSATSSYVLNSQTGSFILTSQTSSMSVASSSVAISASYALTASFALNGGGGTTNTGSLLTTASVLLNTITFTKGDGSTFPITIDTGSGGSSNQFFYQSSVPTGSIPTGSFWYNSSNDYLLVYIDDGSFQYWALPAGNIIFERKSDFQSPYLYCGEAPQGVPENAPIWDIHRITIYFNGTTLTEEATGEWTNRYSLIYT